MCVQDLRISAGMTFREWSGVVPADGILLMPSFRKATQVWGTDPAGNFFLAFRNSVGTIQYVPINSTRYVPGFISANVYTRDMLGPFLYSPTFISGNPGDTIRVYYYEYDAETDDRVLSAFNG